MEFDCQFDSESEPESNSKSTNQLSPSKTIPYSCIQPLSRYPKTFPNQVKNSQIRFLSRFRNGKTLAAMIDEHSIRLKAGLFNELINEYEETTEGVIHLSNVDLQVLKLFFEQPERLETNLYTYCHLMDVGWRYQIDSLYHFCAQFFNQAEIFQGPQALYTSEILRNIMKAIRYRVSPIQQAECLDLILNLELEHFPRAGAFLSNAFYLKNGGGFQHEFDPESEAVNAFLALENNNNSKFQCCQNSHSSQLFIHQNSPLYCSLCEKVLCTFCQHLRCPHRLLSYIQSTFYIRVYKTKCRSSKRTRKSYKALGSIFPDLNLNSDFDTLEDCSVLCLDL